MKTAEKDVDKTEKSSADEPKVDIFDDGIEYEDELDHEKDARLRSYRNPVYRCLFRFVTSVSFNFFIFVLILGNTVTLATYTYDQSDL